MSQFKANFKKLLLVSTPEKVSRLYVDDFNRNGKLSYSVQGEDLILSAMLGEKRNGYYVDVGAHHPVKYSNTMFFFKRGWRGMNIDPMPGCMALFSEVRPEDTNLEIAVSDREGSLTYFMFDDPALNSFSADCVQRHSNGSSGSVISRQELRTRTLASILDEYLPTQQGIDFLSVDVEGWDFNVIKSNNWVKYRPKIVVVEQLDSDIKKLLESELYKFMVAHDYEYASQAIHSVFFKSRS